MDEKERWKSVEIVRQRLLGYQCLTELEERNAFREMTRESPRLPFSGKTGSLENILIKLEVDTNPPDGSGSEGRYLDFPFVSSVSIQARPSLFAGKLHALLCREYVNGRDWYDFLWHTSNRTQVNFSFLASAPRRCGPWKGQLRDADMVWLVENLTKKTESLNWKKSPTMCGDSSVLPIRHRYPFRTAFFFRGK